MDMICIHKHNIGNFRHTVTADIIFKAEFQKEISLMRGNISQKHRMVLKDFCLDGLLPDAQMNLLTDIVFVVPGADFLFQVPGTVFSVNHQHLSGRIESCIDPAHEKYPDHHDHHIDSCHLKQIFDIMAKFPVADQRQLQVSDEIHAEYGQNLRIQHLKYPKVAHFKTAVKLIEKKQKQSILTNDYIVSPVPVPPQHIFFKMMVPHICKDADLNRHDQNRSQKHEQMFVFFSFLQGLPP